MSNEYDATIRDLQTSVMRLQEEKEKLKYDVDTWVSAAEKFSIMSCKSKMQVDKLNSDIEKIRQAIEIEGPYPKVHRKIFNRHRREWPTLWRAIDNILNEHNND